MADAPASLRQADANIYKTAMRAEQLQSVKPIIAYWCDYWVLKQILAKGLHNTDPDILEYSSRLMDKMEQVKETHGTEDAINDDTAGQAYIEQFAQETLDRAQRVVKASKVTATTANTFDAAATFFGLVNVWGAPDAETLQKIKYAKWNATRILKAIKDGSDPNESNPKPDELPPQELLPTDGSSALSPGSEIPPPSAAATKVPRPVTIEHDPDDATTGAELHPGSHFTRRDSGGVSLPQSPASSAASNAHIAPVAGGPALPPPASGPLPSYASPTATPAAAPSLTSYTGGPDDDFSGLPPPNFPSSAATFSPPTAPAPDSFYQHQQQPSAPPKFAPSSHSTAAVAPPSAAGGGGYFTGANTAPPPSVSPATGYPPTYSNRVAPQPSAPPPPVAAPYVPPPANAAAVDDIAMVNAQKHAKWAISALNFEDVTTAVRELRKALECLGAA